MMTLPRLLLTFFVLAFALPSSADAQQARQSVYDQVKTRGTLIAGLRNDFPPAAFVDAQGNWVGYEIELAQYVADKLGVKLQRELVTSRTRIPMLVNGNIDLIIATMGPEKERFKVIDFSVPYIIAGNQVLTRKDTGVKSIADLAAPRRTGMVQGSTDVNMLVAFQPKADVVYFQEWPMAVQALKEKRVDAVFTTDFMLASMSRNDASLQTVGPVLVPGGWAMGVRHDDSKWRTFLDQTIGEAWADGTIVRLYEKYMGYKPTFTLPVWREYLMPAKK